jgi:hypothetical protein
LKIWRGEVRERRGEHGITVLLIWFMGTWGYIESPGTNAEGFLVP